jgi:hypothetical protein
MNMKINTVQLWSLRNVSDTGVLPCSRDSGKALVRRGFACESEDGKFFITDAGEARAKKAADVHVVRDGLQNDPTLMEDLK